VTGVHSDKPSRLRLVAPLIGLGAVGVLVLIPISWINLSARPDLPLPPLLLAVLSTIQPLVLLLVAAFVGGYAAPKLGLRSLVVERVTGRLPGAADLRPLLPLFAVSVLLGIGINLADELTRSLWLPDGADFPRYEANWSPATLVFGILYGGLTEEVLCRWGLMSGLAWLLCAVTGSRRPVPPWIMVAAIVAASLIFAAGHLPAMAQMLPLSPGPVIRTLALNAIAGIWFGWTFWRFHLEAAMVSHAASHVGFAVYALAMLALA
jgi:hypothetical protein